MHSEEDLDLEWTSFIQSSIKSNEEDNDNDNKIENIKFDNNDNNDNYQIIPIASDIYISTKSKIAFLNIPVDLNIFWNIPTIPYTKATDGVIKKQMKFVSTSKEEVENIKKNLEKELYYEEYIMSHVDNPNGRIKYKDVRKVTIGISKKDIMSCRTKKKQAFYNCFVMILRLNINNIFKEYHIKIFNTGKIEIPGIQNDEIYDKVLEYVKCILQPFINEELCYNSTSDTVLINSNFNCGFQINREVLFDILKYKYNIHAIYDPCSYPGIQCKFYYNKILEKQIGYLKNKEEKTKDIIEVSFMIFRTGSVLIVGMCDEYVLFDIYNYLKDIFKTEFNKICHKLIDKNDNQHKDKKRKLRKKTIIIGC